MENIEIAPVHNEEEEAAPSTPADAVIIPAMTVDAPKKKRKTAAKKAPAPIPMRSLDEAAAADEPTAEADADGTTEAEAEDSKNVRVRDFIKFAAAADPTLKKAQVEKMMRVFRDWFLESVREGKAVHISELFKAVPVTLNPREYKIEGRTTFKEARGGIRISAFDGLREAARVGFEKNKS